MSQSSRHAVVNVSEFCRSKERTGTHHTVMRDGADILEIRRQVKRFFLNIDTIGWLVSLKKSGNGNAIDGAEHGKKVEKKYDYRGLEMGIKGF